MEKPQPLTYETPYKIVTVSTPENIKIVQGKECLDGGMVIHNGKLVPFYVVVSGKPELERRVAAWRAEWGEYKTAKAAELATNVPGLEELRRATDAMYNDNARYHSQFERMMENENNDGVNPPAPLDKAIHQAAYDLAAQYPRAVLYLRAEGYTVASNVNKYAAGKRAMEIIATGGSLEDAQAVLDNWAADLID